MLLKKKSILYFLLVLGRDPLLYEVEDYYCTLQINVNKLENHLVNNSNLGRNQLLHAVEDCYAVLERGSHRDEATDGLPADEVESESSFRPLSLCVPAGSLLPVQLIFL